MKQYVPLLMGIVMMVSFDDSTAQVPATSGPVLSVSPAVSGRPLTAAFEYRVVGSDGTTVTRSRRLIRDSFGRVRNEFELTEIPGVGPISIFVVHDHVGGTEYIGSIPSGFFHEPSRPLTKDDGGSALYWVMAPWEPEGPGEEAELDGMKCLHLRFKNEEGSSLDAWVSLEDRILVREIVDGPTGHSWRLVGVDRTEPDKNLFSVGNSENSENSEGHP